MRWQLSAGELCCPTCTVNRGAWVFPARLELVGKSDQSTCIGADPCPLVQLAEGPGWHRERTAFLAAQVDFVIPCLRRKEWLFWSTTMLLGLSSPFQTHF